MPTSPPRPHFTEEVANVTVVVGRDETMRCSVKNLGNHQVSVVAGKDEEECAGSERCQRIIFWGRVLVWRWRQVRV